MSEFLPFDNFFVVFWSFVNTVGVAWLFYTTFIDVIERLDFTLIFHKIFLAS